MLTLSSSPARGGDTYAAWISQLASDDYRTRAAAVRELGKAGESARPALESARRAGDLEVRRSANRLLEELEVRLIATELQRLREAYDPAERYRLAEWQLFRRVCGDGPRHRELYARLMEDHRAELLQLAAWRSAPETELPNFAQEISGLQLQRGNVEQWTLLLLLETSHPDRFHSVLSGRILAALQDPRIAKALDQGHYRGPVTALLESWIEAKRPHVSLRHLLRICLVHDRHDLAQQYAMAAATDDPEKVPAGDRQAALLTLVKIAPESSGQVLQQALQDQRTSHSWNTGGKTREIVRTEVRDAALVSLLMLAGFDPREHGFEHLRPDPLIGFREFSLGFTTDQQRREVHRRGRSLLGEPDVAINENDQTQEWDNLVIRQGQQPTRQPPAGAAR